MPLPLALTALRYLAVTAAVYAVARAWHQPRRDQRLEDAMDELPEGLGLTRDPDRSLRAAGRLRRVVRVGTDGPGLDIDVTGLARLRLRRV